MSTTHTANMANIVELSSDELLSIEGGWGWGDFFGGVAFACAVGVAVAATPVLVVSGLIAGGLALYLN